MGTNKIVTTVNIVIKTRSMEFVLIAKVGIGNGKHMLKQEF